MAIEKGDFVRVNFTGKIKGTDDIFETTYEEIAHETGVFDENKTYKSIPIVVGGNHLLPAIEEGIIGLETGDKKTVEVAADDAFGQRDPSKIQLMHMKDFKKQGMTPVKGMKIQSGDATGKILTVNGGRVKVDFNHELAGRDLVFDVEVSEILEDDNDKIKSMIEFHYANPQVDIDKTEIDIDGDVLNLKMDELAKFDQRSHMDISLIKFRIAKDIYDNIEGIEKVNFIDEFEKPAPSEENSEENPEETKEEDNE